MTTPNLDFLVGKNGRPNVKDFKGLFDTIVPFDTYTTPDIPAQLLPPVLGDFVQNIADVLLVPVAMPFMAALGMVSAAVAKKFVVSPKDDWFESVNIYSFTAMPPANNKSQTLKLLKSPVDEWEEKTAQKIGPDRDKAMTEIKILQTELAKQYNIVKAKKAKSEDLEAAKERIVELEEKIKAQQEALPIIPQIYTTDATPEAIAQLIHEQGGRLGIISDEGGITEVLAGLYSNGNANIDIVLKGIDGGSARIKRQNRDYRLNPYLTIILLVQPKILANMAGKRAFDGNGAFERYLYTLPISQVGYRTFDDQEIDYLYNVNYNNLIYNLLMIEVPEKPFVLKLDTPARQMFRSFRAEIERELRPDGKLYICRGWGGKLAGYTLRLAGLMHIAEHNNPAHLIIQGATMEKAMILARLLMDHAVAAYGLMGADVVIGDAKELLDWIKTQGQTRLTKTDIVNGVRNRGMGKKERLSKAIEVLIERNYLSQPHEDDSTAKPTEVYFINPGLFTKA